MIPRSALIRPTNDKISATTKGMLRRSISAITIALLLQAFIAVSAPGESCPVGSTTLLSQNGLAPIGDIVNHEIEAGRIRGAVVEVGQRGRIVYRRAFGDREIKPERLAMTPDTIFDLASLTKVVATSVAIMQLKERHKIDLDAPVTRYWPGFGRNGKGTITVREMLTHYSGLPADLNLEPRWLGYRTALRMIETEKPLDPPGAHYRYSDINFEVLGELVHRVSGLALEVYSRVNIFDPLRMTDTFFKPPAADRTRIAPTGYTEGRLRLGEVHDPTAARMGGVAGHAGLFSTAADLANFAQMMLNRGNWHGIQILSQHSVDEMTNIESPAGAVHLRGLGWDLAAPFCSDRDQFAQVGSYVHTGFTGTMIWIDPGTESYVIILTNRTYPSGAGDAGPLRQQLVHLISNSLGP
jgi:CubicO group peptidase (beta-lactamase class C family)